MRWIRNKLLIRKRWNKTLNCSWIILSGLLKIKLIIFQNRIQFQATFHYLAKIKIIKVLSNWISMIILKKRYKKNSSKIKKIWSKNKLLIKNSNKFLELYPICKIKKVN
jgi:hypothetical protein